MSNVYANYSPPGVYVFEEPSAVSSGPITVDSSTVAILGPSVGYQNATESVNLVGTDKVRLAQSGIDTSSVVVLKGDTTQAVLNDDYTLTPAVGPDGVPGSGDETLDIERSAGTTIGDGESVIVSYRYTDASYFTARTFTDYNAVRDAYGSPFDPATGAIVSPLALAAKFAFDNGATRLVLVPVAGSATSVDVDDINAAYTKILSLEDVGIVVPLGVGINGTEGSPGDTDNLGLGLEVHINNAESQGVRRIGILGYEIGVDRDPSLLASTIKSSRIMAMWPNRLSYYNSAVDQTQTLGGQYLAAAAAGRLSALPVNYPLTRKSIAGFSGLPSTTLAGMTRAVKDGWSKNGVAVAEITSRRGLAVRHGLSTDTSTVLTREISITRARDSMVGAIVMSLDGADLIGSPIVSETPARIKGIVAGVLETMVDSDTIVGYSGLSVRQTSIDPSVIEVKFQYRPAYPLNYIEVVFGIDPTTGEITETNAELVP